MSPGNVEKTMAAPVVAITGYDLKFYEHLPFLFPHADAKSWFSGNPEFAARSRRPERHAAGRLFHPGAARRRPRRGPDGRLRPGQGRGGVLPRGDVKANVVINIGYGDDAKLFPRSPRFAFDQMAKIL